MLKSALALVVVFGTISAVEAMPVASVTASDALPVTKAAVVVKKTVVRKAPVRRNRTVVRKKIIRR